MIEEIYNNLLKDKEIIDIYNKIGQIEDEEKRWAYHNNNHIKNVTNIVENILIKLKYDKEFISKAKIACFFHDVGALQGKENHAERSYEFTKEYFQKNNISFQGIDDVLFAIKNHSNGFDSDNIIALSLILADKLDIKKTRITEEGKKIKGNRQYSHIEDILINIENKTLIIDFITDNKININEVNEYYFTKKVFKAIESFSKKIKINFKILIDNKEWIIEE